MRKDLQRSTAYAPTYFQGADHQRCPLRMSALVGTAVPGHEHVLHVSTWFTEVGRT